MNPHRKTPAWASSAESVRLCCRAGQSRMLQVLFVADQSFTETTGPEFLRTLVERSPGLSAIRLNSVDGYLNRIDLNQFTPNLDNLRTIQIMHGHKMLVSTHTTLTAPRPLTLNSPPPSPTPTTPS